MKILSLMAVGLSVTGAFKSLELFRRKSINLDVNMDRDFEMEMIRELECRDYRFRNTD